MRSCYSGEDIDSLFVNFDFVLISQLTQVALHFFIQVTELFVQILLLTQFSLEHLNLITKLVVFKLIFV